MTALAALLATAGHAQESKEAANPAFEVVSVKPSGDNIVTPGHPRLLYGFRYSGLRVICDQQLSDIIQEAYSVRDFQIVGPDWLGTLTYAVDAVMPAGATKDSARLMLRTMLEERFGLRFHREQKDVPVYALVEAKGGSKLHEISDPSQAKLRAVSTSTGQGRANAGGGPGHIWAAATSLDNLANNLSFHTDRPVLNLTNLKGLYEIEMQWTPEEGAGHYDAGLFPAVEQLGLKLESRKMPYEMLVVDHVEKTPTAN